MTPADERPVAIGARLVKYPQVMTIGCRPNFTDYTPEEQRLILNAKKIYFPTAFYADLFNTLGIDTFPSFHTYKFALDKIKQSTIFQMAGIPHPKTRVFYGPRQKEKILDHFSFPLVAKQARGSSKGRHVFLIRNTRELDSYLNLGGPAYIQEYLPIERDIRVVIIGKKIRLAYWRLAPRKNFKTNLSQGGRISFDPVPKTALNLALETANTCGWDDIGLDIITHRNRFYILEANVKYGTRGFKAAGLDYKGMLAELITSGEI